MEKLTHAEEETMQAVWRTGEGNVKAFMEQLESDIPYTTVASTIKNLEKKGYLTSRLLGNAYLYQPAVSEEEYKKKFMGKVVREYFDNSYYLACGDNGVHVLINDKLALSLKISAN